MNRAGRKLVNRTERKLVIPTEGIMIQFRRNCSHPIIELWIYFLRSQIKSMFMYGTGAPHAIFTCTFGQLAKMLRRPKHRRNQCPEELSLSRSSQGSLQILILVIDYNSFSCYIFYFLTALRIGGFYNILKILSYGHVGKRRRKRKKEILVTCVFGQ